jgi:hypothetical protein
MRRILGMTLTLTLATAGLAHANAPAVSLRGSPAAMQQQNRVAKEHDLAFYRTSAQIHSAVERGDLVELTGNENYAVAEFVRHPFVQPEVLLFVERLSQQYREACGQRLVVTSAVRPMNGQPSNSHALSVHPTGMALDLRVSDRASCRSWLESALLNLESRGVLNGIREHRPPHYHVAVFPSQYYAYAQERLAVEEEERRKEALAQAAEEAKRQAERTAAIVESAGAAALLAPEVAEPERRASGALTAALALLALPFGVGVMLRRRRSRG